MARSTVVEFSLTGKAYSILSESELVNARLRKALEKADWDKVGRGRTYYLRMRLPEAALAAAYLDSIDERDITDNQARPAWEGASGIWSALRATRIWWGAMGRD